MSNHLAIATVTATLQRLLQQSVQNSVEGARVISARPEAQGGSIPETGICLYLYHLRRNDAYGNADTPGRQRRADIARRNQLAIDLYYVLSFYGHDSALEPHRLLGSTLQLFEDRSMLSRDMIRETLADPTYDFLADSDLGDQLEMMWFELLPLSTDELSKIWSVFFQTPHALSVCYKVTVVMIEGQEPGRRALPVRDRRLGLVPFNQQPMVEQVIAATGRYDPILSNSMIRIHGRALSASIVQVRVAGVEVRPVQVTDTDILLPLNTVPPDALKIGVQSLQVIHSQVQRRGAEQRQPVRTTQGNGMRRNDLQRNGTVLSSSSINSPTGDRTQNAHNQGNHDQSDRNQGDRSLLNMDTIYRGVESNVTPFIVRPTIQRLQVNQTPGLDDDPRSAIFEVTTDLPVQVGQRTLLCLNERSIDQPQAYVFEGDRLHDASPTLIFRTQGLKPGEYLIRLQVDGAESVLQVDQNPQSPTFEQYIGPSCTIS
ncbi:MAG: DUF4255 domain-containing protein [Cyanobacteria bacterium P01_F01_bin.150]